MDNPNHILLVDCDKKWQRQYKLVLENAGYIVKVANNYDEAISSIQHLAFDVVISNVQLDETDPQNADGLRVVAQINKLENRPQIILVSSQLEMNSAWKDFVFGVADKTDDRGKLLDLIERALEKKETISPTETKNTLISILNKMVSERLGLEEVLSLILREMTSLIKANVAFLSLVQGNKLIIKATLQEQNLIDRKFDVENSISGLAVRRQKTVHITDIVEDNLYKTVPNSMRSGLAIPIMLGLEPIAVVNFESEKPNAFTLLDVQLLEELAGQIAIAINSARLQDQTLTVKRLSEISSEINAAVVLGEMAVAKIALSKMIDFMKCDKAAVFIVDEEHSELNLLAQIGLSEEFVSKLNINLDSPRANVAKTHQSVIVSDIKHDKRFDSVRDLAIQEGVQSIFELPLLVSGKTIGSIVAYYTTPHDFDPEELAVAKLFAGHFGIALNNAQQYQELEEAKQRTAMAAIGELAGDIVHRMNSPLGAIRANATLLSLEYQNVLEENPGLAKTIREIDRIAGEGINMVRTMREKARQDMLEIVDIRTIISNALSTLEIPPNVILKNKIDNSQLPHSVRANRNLTRVFMNLFINAIDAMPQGGKITLDAKPFGDYLEISVEDTGVGIPEEWREDVFNLLSVFSKKRADGGGHGLGLWYCRAYVEACGGEMPPPESAGKGTKFIVRLLLAQGQ